MSKAFLFTGAELLEGISGLPEDICIQDYDLTGNISDGASLGGQVSRVHALDVLMPERGAAGPQDVLSSLGRKTSDDEQHQKSQLQCYDQWQVTHAWD